MLSICCPPARQNRLLAALPPDDWRRLKPALEPVVLQPGQLLCAAGAPPAGLYFPASAIVSVLGQTRCGATPEIALIGSEGVAGLALFMGGDAMPGREMVQFGGSAYRLAARHLAHELARAGPPLALLLRYTDFLITRVAQAALCNRYHSIDQQVSRRLLAALDRTRSDELPLTQQELAALLGVRREGVCIAARKLRDAGVIHYGRGRIVVLDRSRLESCVCECYRMECRAHERLFATPAPA